jgi:hypothetical protein
MGIRLQEAMPLTERHVNIGQPIKSKWIGCITLFRSRLVTGEKGIVTSRLPRSLSSAIHIKSTRSRGIT